MLPLELTEIYFNKLFRLIAIAQTTRVEIVYYNNKNAVTVFIMKKPKFIQVWNMLYWFILDSTLII